MTMPSEEVWALKNARDFLRALLMGPRLPMKELRKQAYDCLRHYPCPSTIDRRWRDKVCRHGKDIEFCRECIKNKAKTSGKKP